MPHTLIYASSAAFAMDDGEVEILLAHSRKRNAADGITGLLVYVRLDYDHAAFVQVLQGPREQVEETYRRIERDELHRDPTVLLRSSTEPARFEDWSMKFATLDVEGLREAARSAGWADEVDTVADPTALLRDRATVERVVSLFG